MLGGLKQKHKKQPFSDASASHLSLVLRHVWFQAEAWIRQTTPLTPPSYEVGGIAKRIKTARLRRKTKLQKSDYPKAQINQSKPKGRFFFWFALVCMIYVSHNRRAHKLRHNVGTCLRHVSNAFDTLLFASKHAKGMSLRCDAIFYSLFQIIWFLKFGFSPKASGFYPFGDATDLVRGRR